MATRPTLDLWAVLSESKRIINAHSRHFLALSVIFLLPLSFSLIVYPTLLQLLNDHPFPPNTSHVHILLRHLPHQPPPISTNHNHNPNTPLFFLSYSLFLFVFSVCAVATITHSVFHGFFGRPVKLLSAIKSILSSFLPLLATVIVSQAIVFLLSFLFGLLCFLVIQGIQLLGITVSFNSPYFFAFCALLLLPLLFLVVYLQVTWTLVSVIVVVESSWGVEPLRRSAGLMKGMKGVGLSALFLFGFLEGVLVWSSSALTVGGSDGGGGAWWWKDWAFVAQIVLTSTLLMLLLLYSTAANTVMYMYCKAVHGELALEIADEFAWEYVSFPFDEGKVPHVVSVVHHV